MKDDGIPRNQWRVWGVVEDLPDKDGLVRKVRLEVGSQNLAFNGKRNQLLSMLERPIHKLMLLTWFVQLQTNQIQGLFKNFTRTKNSFQGLSFLL